MRYFFESKVEKKDAGYTIQIPFNVWEVCHQREGIKGDIVLDDHIHAVDLADRVLEAVRAILVHTDQGAVNM